METSKDERIRTEDKKVPFFHLNPGSASPNLRDEYSRSDNDKMEVISDQIPGTAPTPKNEQEPAIFSTSDSGLTALAPLASLTAPALQAPPRAAEKSKHKRQWLQEREESPRKELMTRRVVSLQELHRRRGLTLFQFFWEQGMTCG